MHAYIHVGLESKSLAELTVVVCSLTGWKKEACFDGDEYLTFFLFTLLELSAFSPFSSSFLYFLLIWLRFECRSIWMSSLWISLAPQILQ